MLLLGGCAHQISMKPHADMMPTENTKKINKTVGYYISDENKKIKVETPGGGGDSVEYTPYKDIEFGLYKVLSNVYTDVHPMKAANNKSEIKTKNVSYVFVPQVKTNSSSNSAFTWPPTYFEVVLNVKAYDANGKKIWNKTVTGKGRAEYDEFKNDFQLSARRASAQCFKNLQKMILSEEKLR